VKPSSLVNPLVYARVIRRNLAGWDGYLAGWGGYLALKRADAGLVRAIADSSRYTREMRPTHERYVTSVSDEVNAISLRLATTLRGLCEFLRPNKVVDLGSGYSSHVLRSYSARADHPVEVWSVDDNEMWLGRTADFLAADGLSTNKLSLWSDFVNGGPGDFDMVVHDLGVMSTRAETLDKALHLAAAGGVVVLDDVHFRAYWSVAAGRLRDLDWPVFNTAWRTWDRIHRYSALVMRPSGD
jgi:predicted O-methyltransferase YrrM